MGTGCVKYTKLILVMVTFAALAVIFCPNAFSFTDISPASTTTVGAGGQISATGVSATTATNMGVSGTTPGMSYSISASGTGDIGASMAFQSQQSFGPVGWEPFAAPVFTWEPIAAPVFTFDPAGLTQAQIGAAVPDPANYHFPAMPVFPPMVLFERFENVSSASGAWTFSTDYSFGSGGP